VLPRLLLFVLGLAELLQVDQFFPDEELAQPVTCHVASDVLSRSFVRVRASWLGRPLPAPGGSEPRREPPSPPRAGAEVGRSTVPGHSRDKPGRRAPVPPESRSRKGPRAVGFLEGGVDGCRSV